MILYANKKFIDASRVVHLLTTGEKYADKLIFSVDRTYNGKDLSDCLFVIRGVNSAGGLIRESLSSNTDKETILLTWNASPAFTAVPGMLALEIVCYDNESMILKYTISPLQVRESVLEGYSGGTDAIEEAIKEMEQILNENRLVSVNLPKIENGNWQLYNPESGTYEDSGQPVHGTNGKDGQNGESAFEIAVKNGFSGTESEWLESLKGDKGDKGESGADGHNGDSAYQIWLNAGNVGTEEDFLTSLKGEKGDVGEPGPPGANGQDGIPGKDGTDGTNGKSAYQIWLDTGNIGTEEDFFASLKGDKGETGMDGKPGINGKDGTPGKDGGSAYEIAVKNGFSGPESEWLESLKGSDGLPGKDGEKGADGTNGQDGTNGSDGISPTVTLTEQADGILISITDADGTHTAFIKHGNDGGVDLTEYAKKTDVELLANNFQILSENVSSLQNNYDGHLATSTESLNTLITDLQSEISERSLADTALNQRLQAIESEIGDILNVLSDIVEVTE